MAGAITDNRVAPLVPFLPHVQAIDSALGDVMLRGAKLTERIDADLLEGKVLRKMTGASSLTLTIDDHGGRVLRSGLLEEAFVVEIDGLRFVFVGYEGETAEPLTLTLEAETAWRLKQLHGPFKAFRDEMTRAEVAKNRVMQLPAPRPRFVCPELHKAQPIKSDREARKAKQTSTEERGHGIGDGAELELKPGEHEKADAAQLELGDMALRIAESHEAPAVVMVALIAALIDETLMGKLSSNVLEAEGSGEGAEVTGAAQEIINFLIGKGGYPEGGAIGYSNHHPDAGPAQIATAMQNNAAGAAPYEQCVPSARRWVSAFGGGSISSPRPERFPFEQKKGENNWAFITGLAQPVNWRCFESAGWIYFISEPDLLRSAQRMLISDSSPGVLNTKIKGTEGKKKDEVTIEVIGDRWSAPPGSAVLLDRHGPADGIYLVEQIEAPLTAERPVLEVQLKRPTRPKKEPAPEVRRTSVKFGGGEPDERANANAPDAVQRMVEEVDATTGTFEYEWGGGHDPATIGRRLKGYDCSGYLSHILWSGGLLNSPEASGALESFGEPGEGSYCTIYANAEHAFGKLLTADGWRYFGSGGTGDNARGWVGKSTSEDVSNFVARHPKGM